jgi:beta-lactamase class A
MVGSAFGLDPLAHREADRGITLWNKTGTDAGVRADVGVVHGPRRALAYAVLAEWSPTADPALRDRVLAVMGETGRGLRSLVRGDPSTGLRTTGSAGSRL